MAKEEEEEEEEGEGEEGEESEEEEEAVSIRDSVTIEDPPNAHQAQHRPNNDLNRPVQATGAMSA